MNMTTMTTTIYAQIDSFAGEASAACGASHDVYVQRLTSSVNDWLETLPEDQHAEVIRIAKTFDYASAEELEQMRAAQVANGECRHGLDADTCPAGCFE